MSLRNDFNRDSFLQALKAAPLAEQPVPTAIESPYSWVTEAERILNLRYLDCCILDSLARLETPYASHRMLTSALDDKDQAERAIGIAAGLAFAVTCPRRAFYVDFGMSSGMVEALRAYENAGLSFEFRQSEHVVDPGWESTEEEADRLRAALQRRDEERARLGI